MRALTRTTIVTFGLLMATVAGCGDESDDDASSGSTAAPDGSAASTSSAATPTGDTVETGPSTTDDEPGESQGSSEPIKFVVISGTGPGTTGVDVVPGAEAAVEAVNAEGGVNGRMLEMEFCDAQTDPNLAGQCARDAVGDDAVLATVGNTLYAGGEQINPVLEEAGMAAVATRAFAPADYESPIVFTIDGGGLVAIPGSNSIMASRGLQEIVTAAFDVPAALAGFEFINETIVPNYPGMSTKFVGVPPTATDVSTYVADAIRDDPEGLHIGANKALAVNFINGARSQGYTGTMTVPASVMTAEDISSQLGDRAGDLLLPASVSHDSEGWRQFETEMAEFRPDAPANETAALAWIGVHQFADVLADVEGELTRASVLDAFSSLEDWTLGGLLPPLTYTEPYDVEGYSRLFNPTVFPLEWRDGALVDAEDAGFVNMFTGEIVAAGG